MNEEEILSQVQDFWVFNTPYRFQEMDNYTIPQFKPILEGISIFIHYDLTIHSFYWAMHNPSKKDKEPFLKIKAIKYNILIDNNG